MVSYESGKSGVEGNRDGYVSSKFKYYVNNNSSHTLAK